MVAALVILAIGLMPPLISLWILRRSDERNRQNLALALESYATRGLPLIRRDSDHYYIDGLGYIVGDITCQFNARSPYIRCAINPSGPCEQCRHYDPKFYGSPVLSAED